LTRALVSFRKALSTLPPESTQALLVASRARGPLWAAALSGVEKNRGTWRQVLGPFGAVIGRNGFAPPGEKREGDGKTPSGVFPLEHTFGYAERISTGMTYRPIRDGDIWVDDPESCEYNRWTERGQMDGVSFEAMRRKDDLYKYGIVIGYNRDPVVKGHGSAVFLHIWQAYDVPTSGCVALAEGDLLEILAWLDPSRRPLVIMGGEEGGPSFSPPFEAPNLA
jgi:L,D-peptidoglycan transpeptidase YkuD (ErfK/YbiS/YcfS/YnhG family)